MLLRRSGHQDRRPLEAALAQVGESLVRCSQWVTDRLGPYVRLPRDCQELEPVAASQVRDRDDLTFLPEGKLGMSLM